MQIICTFCNGDKKVQCHECKGENMRSLPCPTCKGLGSLDNGKCSTCLGEGLDECADCKGTGKDSEGRTCLNCRGKGIKHCSSCNGSGVLNKSINCTECEGQGYYNHQCNCNNGFQTCESCQGEGVIPDPVEVRRAEEQKILILQKEKEREEKRNKSVEEYDQRQLNKEKKARNYKIQIIVVVIAIIITSYFKFQSEINGIFKKKETKNSVDWLLAPSTSTKAIEAAKTLLNNILVSPSSAKLVSSKVVAQESPFYLVHLVVDSQNEFGAMIRTSALVSIELVGSGEQFKYNLMTSTQESSNPPLDIEIELVKQLNQWPSTLKNTEPELASPSDIVKEIKEVPTDIEETSPKHIGRKSWTTPPAMKIDITKSYEAEITTSKGIFTIELFVKDAPMTVNNFVFLTRQGFYNNVIVHRIIESFMIQTGDPTGTGMGGPGYQFEDEKSDYQYEPGIVAMANAGPNTNGSQFFICTGDDSVSLNSQPNYTIFGKVTDGMNVVKQIAATPVEVGGSGEQSSPMIKVTIDNIEIIER